MPTVDCGTRAKWRSWLKAHHRSKDEVWLVFHKRHTGRPSVDYDDAVCEALCFGWIDSLIMRLDDARYARKFTPRRSESRWSSSNRRRYERMQSAGLLAAEGKRLAPTAKSGDAFKPDVAVIPADLGAALERNGAARRAFEGLPASQRRMYLAWILSAKREDTRQRRLGKAIEMLSRGERLGLS
jgi:uncharacterized protein YdeI (YjbR/CyaY-like superfamily)